MTVPDRMSGNVWKVFVNTVCMHKCVMHFLIFLNRICMYVNSYSRFKDAKDAKDA